MKAGCSIVEKPEGGGGEQKLIISDVPGMPLSDSCSLHLGSAHRCETMTDLLTGCIAGTVVGLFAIDEYLTQQVTTPLPKF